MQVGGIWRARAVRGARAIASLLFASAAAHAAPPRDAGTGGVTGGVAFSVATRIPRATLATGASASQLPPSITMSEGWACARFESERGPIHQCWDAGPNPRAFAAPGMKDRIYVARDRWCEHDVHGLTFRCWQRPRRGDKGPRAMPASWQWLNPNNASWEESYSRGDRLYDVMMGGTFACLRVTRKEGVFCLGDDRFGQLGSSVPPRPQSPAGDPGFVRDVGPEVTPALGTWHACALAPPRTMTEEIPVVCWGRGDHGQLGAPAPDKCTVDGTVVPCARTPVRGPRVKDQMAVVGAGDLFTCVTSEEGTKCWGANRDGLFGVRGSCPVSLRSAWPTPDGPVPAPNASCTTTPVPLPGASGFDPYLRVWPRQIFSHGRYVDAVPRPRDPKIGLARVSPGSDASACAVRGDGVVCWGEKYSPALAQDQVVPVVFEALPGMGDQAIIDGPAATASAGKAKCQSERACSQPAQRLPRCEGDNDPGRPVAEILGRAQSLSGGVVRVRGALGVGPLVGAPSVADMEMQNESIRRASCDPAVTCCKQTLAPVLVGGADGAVSIEGMWCSGDESRACCNAPAFGQTVIASGVLVREQRHLTTVGWRVVNGSVCEVGAGR